MTGLLRVVISTFVVVVATATAFAEPSAVDSKGRVHAVEEVLWSDGVHVGGTALQYIVQDADGSSRAEIVPGTDDLYVDRNPALTLDPITEQPILVWTRNEGDDSDILMTRRDDCGWRSPIAVAAGPEDQTEPRISALPGLIHVVWLVHDGEHGDTAYRMSLGRATLEPAFGPEKLPRTSLTLVPENGGPETNVESSTDDLTYFAAILDTPQGSGDETIVVWGIRDEPLPITYVREFAVGPGFDDARNAAAGVRGGRLVTWFVAAGAVHYSVREDGVWSDFRLIELDEETDVADAIRLVEQRNLRDRVRSSVD